MTMELKTVDDLVVFIQAAIDLVKEKPDNVYRSEGPGCCYNSGKTTDGECGCLFGQAGRKCGIDTSTWEDGNNIRSIIGEEMGYKPLNPTRTGEDHLFSSLRAAQQSQDVGRPWSKSLPYLEEALKLTKSP